MCETEEKNQIINQDYEGVTKEKTGTLNLEYRRVYAESGG